jgi:hypothetical protein
MESASKHCASHWSLYYKGPLAHLLGLEWVIDLFFILAPYPVTGYPALTGGCQEVERPAETNSIHPQV